MKKVAFCIFLMMMPLMAADDLPVSMQDRGFASIGAGIQSWDQEKSKPLQQVATPIVVFYPINKQVYLNISNTPASSTFDTLSISGASDTWIKTTYVTEDERYMFNVGLGIPTGKTRLKYNEFLMTRYLSEQALGYRMPIYGQGISIKAGIGIAHPVGQTTMAGFGVNYILKQPYNLLDMDSTEFNPGNEINIVGGVNTKIGRSGSFSLDAVYTIYETDLLNNQELVDSGAKILLAASIALTTKQGPVYASLMYRQRGKNNYYAYQNLPSYSKQTIGSQIDFNAIWQFKNWKQGNLSLLIDAKEYGENEDKIGGATIYGGGLGVQQAVSLQTMLQFQAKYLTGTLYYGNEVNLTGFDVLARILFYY